MGLLLVFAIAAASIWLIAGAVRVALFRQSLKHWLALSLLTALGIVVGLLWMKWEYQAGSKMRIQGFPMPLVFFHLEDGHWVDFPIPLYVGWPGLVTNVIAGVAVCVLPFRLFWKRNA
jgi:hypothetical protein